MINCQNVFNKSTKEQSKVLTEEKKIKYIFNFMRWRNELGLINPRILAALNVPLCSVPVELKPIADAHCKAYDGECFELPCHYIDPPSVEAGTMNDVMCTREGKKVAEHQNADIHCKSSHSLNLFRNAMKNQSSYSYPSVIIEGLTKITDELWINVLSKYRSHDTMWGMLFNGESIAYYPWAGDYKKIRLFDITMGYDRSLYDIATPGYVLEYAQMIIKKPKRFLHVSRMKTLIYPKNTSTGSRPWNSVLENKNKMYTSRKTYVTAPIMWMNSNCQTPSNRTEYMTELMKYIDVDNWGECLSNKKALPPHIVKIQGGESKERDKLNWKDGKMALASEYLFTIAIENSLTHDYVTEKLWQPLVAGSVPIYLGAPNIDEWLPCENCIIDLRKFKTPQDAAKFLNRVAENKTLYETYHQWRSRQVTKHFQNLLSYFNYTEDYSLDCIVCHMAHRADAQVNPYEIKRQFLTYLNPFNFSSQLNSR
ncbi:unnamed protein product [Didymodactylos carnosus]|uniref:Fucosyltransferase n=1 Tax=Didymodactylos carnosus TaxID=1234261 RepID=A0A815R9D4_9BILA|nr:unnamed protein product [Didymodactylos carnosus]CAF1474373.1 unnamed protein product [Didymodactylos carnosus]CAF3860178.1 unnamed protein product [Didymodactylos carnosus]CAF4341112.1 unnamed protein product [Didymodactylos carnosus]